MTFAALTPILFMLADVIKRFIPKRHRKVLTPLVTMGTGVGIAWATGGHTIGMETLAVGVGAGATAIGLYKAPKEMGKILLKEK